MNQSRNQAKERTEKKKQFGTPLNKSKQYEVNHAKFFFYHGTPWNQTYFKTAILSTLYIATWDLARSLANIKMESFETIANDLLAFIFVATVSIVDICDGPG